MPEIVICGSCGFNFGPEDLVSLRLHSEHVATCDGTYRSVTEMPSGTMIIRQALGNDREEHVRRTREAFEQRAAEAGVEL
jgi:hypothetical protein